MNIFSLIFSAIVSTELLEQLGQDSIKSGRRVAVHLAIWVNTGARVSRAKIGPCFGTGGLCSGQTGSLRHQT